MAEGEPEIIVIPQTALEKLIFYTTAFFILLGTFSLFAFLFLVPFVIDPAFTTIFMHFEPEPVTCVTTSTVTYRGASNCSWSSCKEGCTRELYDCTQIRVDYKVNVSDTTMVGATSLAAQPRRRRRRRRRRSPPMLYLDDADQEEVSDDDLDDAHSQEGLARLVYENGAFYFRNARLFPNVKGCGYPPMLNCSIFFKRYRELGSNYSCYYSTVDPELVITELDMWQVYMNLVYAMAIPIPSFILSVIYLTIAYFKIYNDDDGAATGAETTPLPQATAPSAALTPVSDVFRDDLASFGHQLKVAMADETSRDSLVDADGSTGGCGGLVTPLSTGNCIAFGGGSICGAADLSPPSHGYVLRALPPSSPPLPLQRLPERANFSAPCSCSVTD